jgi:hypothetical protein
MASSKISIHHERGPWKLVRWNRRYIAAFSTKLVIRTNFELPEDIERFIEVNAAGIKTVRADDGTIGLVKKQNEPYVRGTRLQYDEFKFNLKP